LPDRVGAGQDQNGAADILREVAEIAGDRLADEKADDRHQRFEQPENHSDLEPGAAVDAREADADRAREVAQADRHAHQEKSY